jgi:hypothetical protein
MPRPWFSALAYARTLQTRRRRVQRRKTWPGRGGIGERPGLRPMIEQMRYAVTACSLWNAYARCSGVTFGWPWKSRCFKTNTRRQWWKFSICIIDLLFLTYHWINIRMSFSDCRLQIADWVWNVDREIDIISNLLPEHFWPCRHHIWTPL